MSEQKTYQLSADQCLSLDSLYDFVEGKLNDADTMIVEQHVAGCPLCEAVLEEARSTPRAAAQAMTTRVLEKLDDRLTEEETPAKVIPLWPKIAAAAAGVALLLFIGLQLFETGNQSELAEYQPRQEEASVEESQADESNEAELEPVQAEQVQPIQEDASTSEEPAQYDRSNKNSTAAVEPKRVERKREVKTSNAIDLSSSKSGAKESEQQVLAKESAKSYANSTAPSAPKPSMEKKLAAPSANSIAVPSSEYAGAAVAEDAVMSQELAMVTIVERESDELQLEEISTKSSNRRMKVASAPAVTNSSIGNAATAEATLTRHIAQRMVYPTGRKFNKGEVVIRASFTIDPDGKVSRTRITSGYSKSLDDFVLAIIDSIPASIASTAAGGTKTKFEVEIQPVYEFVSTSVISKGKK